MALSDLIYIDSTGFHFPDYPTILEYYKGEYRSIYGADTYLESDSQDGQWISIKAQADYDLCAVMAGIYNGFSPAYGSGDMLSRTVKINGLSRRVATNSTVDLYIVGTAGTTITDGVAQDTVGNNWDLPSPTVIGVGGTVTVTATAREAGAISAVPSSITTIATPTRGWLTVTNPSAAVEGVAVQSDAELRLLQAASTMLPSINNLTAIRDGIANVDGVTRSKVYENDTAATDADGVPEHSICAVVEGGDAQDIVDAIGVKKPPGCGTFGTTSGTYTDEKGETTAIDFMRPTSATISVNIDITALTGYVSNYETEMKQAVADYINGLAIGEDVLYSRMFAPATLSGNPNGLTYNLTLIEIKKNAGSFVTTDLTIDFDEISECDPSTDITVTVT